MIARFPSRFNLFYVLIIAVLVGTFQLLQGSDPYCVGCVFVFTLIGADAFNRCGGLIYPSGSYILFFGVLTLWLAAVWKVFLWEPLDRNMVAPQLTFTVYAVGMASMWVAAVVNVRLRTKKPILKTHIPAEHEMRAAMGCLLIGLSLDLLVMPVVVQLGLGGTVLQLNTFYPLATMLAVYFRVRQTGGETSFSGVALASWFVGFLIGVLSFSKQGLFTPYVAWLFGALAAGYKTSWKQIAIVSAAGVGCALIFVPYSQYGRTHREEFSNPFQAMAMMVTEPQVILEKGNMLEESRTPVYKFFDEPQGIMDRLNMLTLDDPLIYRTSLGNYEGWIVVKANLMNALPHFILPNKPNLRFGNIYAHEIGILAPSDLLTGVSFSPVAESFHIAGWFSLIVVLPLILLPAFWVSDSLTGSLRDGPWALYFILLFSHYAPEGGIGRPFYIWTYAIIVISFAIFMATKVAPLIGTILLGPAKVPVHAPDRLRSMSRGREGT